MDNDRSFADVKPPAGDGVGVTVLLRRVPTPGRPLLSCTGRVEAGRIVEFANNVGALDYLIRDGANARLQGSAKP